MRQRLDLHLRQCESINEELLQRLEIANRKLLLQEFQSLREITRGHMKRCDQWISPDGLLERIRTLAGRNEDVALFFHSRCNLLLSFNF